MVSYSRVAPARLDNPVFFWGDPVFIVSSPAAVLSRMTTRAVEPEAAGGEAAVGTPSGSVTAGDSLPVFEASPATMAGGGATGGLFPRKTATAAASNSSAHPIRA